jgi:predicted RNase H-like HicB family nuclease
MWRSMLILPSSKKEGELYSICFPDLESCYTSAESVQEGLEMANDVLCLTLYEMEQEGKSNSGAFRRE